LFFLLLLGVPCALAHFYLWRRLVGDTTRPGGPGRRWGTVALGLAFAVMMAAVGLAGRIPPRYAQFVAWPGYLWVAMTLYLTMALAVLEIPRRIVIRRALRVPASVAASEIPQAGPTRRVFIAQSFALAGSIGAAGIVGYGTMQALGAPAVKNIPITLSKLDPRLSGFRIAVVSDIHLGPILGRSHTERLVRMINEQQPDLVAIVGDLVDGTVENLGSAAEPLRDLVSKHGSFFVTGNHEYYSGVQPWLRELEHLNVHPLSNERVAIQRGGAGFDLAGINDVTGKSYDDAPDVARALAGRDVAQPVVLLAHQPVQVSDAASHGVDLQLSGHTHGGQMFPFNLVVGLQQPSVAGLSKVDNTWLYVSRGTGFWGPPVRVGAPPDISMMELRSGPSS
jgi:predicted MPP superfamily phosphohydrolase